MTRKILIAIDPLTPDFEIIETDAPNEIITEQMNQCRKNRKWGGN